MAIILGKAYAYRKTPNPQNNKIIATVITLLMIIPIMTEFAKTARSARSIDISHSPP